MLKIIISKWSLRFIGLVLLVLICIYKVNWVKFLHLLTDLNWVYFFGAVGVMVVGSTIKPYRWQFILNKLNISYGFLKSYQLYFIGLFLGTFTPGRIGEAGKVFYLKKDGHSLLKSLISIIIDRLADLFYLFFVGLIGFVIFLPLFKKLSIWATFLSILLVLGLIILVKNRGAKILFKKLLLFLTPAKYKNKTEDLLSEFLKSVRAYTLRDYLIIGTLTLLCWLPSFVSVVFLAKSVNIDNLPYLYLFFAIAITSIVTMLPLSISGIGTREATLLLLFSPFNISVEQIISLSFLIFVSNFIVIPLIGFVCWFKNPLQIKKNNCV